MRSKKPAINFLKRESRRKSDDGILDKMGSEQVIRREKQRSLEKERNEGQ